jgi:hypothetical protein
MSLEEINSRREKALSDALEVIYSLMENHQAGGYCKRTDRRAAACDSMLLGSLLKGCQNAGIWPPPVAPYKAMTFKSLKDKISSFEIQTLCGILGEAYKHYGAVKWMADRATPPVKGSIDEKMIAIENEVAGLTLYNFLSESERQNFPESLLFG